MSDAQVFGATGGAIAAIFTAGLIGGLRPLLNQANGALVLALVIIAAAYIGGPWAGGATALAAAAGFDFFLTKPYGSLAIKSAEDIITTVLLFVTGIVVGRIAGKGWEARAASRAGTEEVAGMHRIARLTTRNPGLYELIDSVEAEVTDLLALADCTFTMVPPDPALPEMDENGRIDAPYVHLGEGFALPPGGMSIPVHGNGRVQGWLVCHPSSTPTGISRDRRRAAVVHAELLGLTLAKGDTEAA